MLRGRIRKPNRFGLFRTLSIAVAATMTVLCASAAGGDETESDKSMKPVFVRGIGFWGLSNKTLSEKQLLSQSITFAVGTGENADVYYAVSESAHMPRKTMQLKDVGSAANGRMTILTGAAVREVMQAVSRTFQAQGVAAVRVSVTKPAIDRLRGTDSDGILYVTVTEGIVGQVGVVGKGADGEDKPLDGDKHDIILENSPVQEGDAVHMTEVEDYLHRLNRAPQRTVESEIRPGERPGEVNLHYVVHERKPWLAYLSLDNTGTESTSELRERFSFRHFDLTGIDDILALDYVTGNFDSVHQVVGSYDAPLRIPGIGPVRGRVYGMWSEYTASEIGLFNTDLTGTSTQIGVELKGICWQEHAMFLDGLVGLRFQHVEADDELTGIDGSGDFVLAYGGLQLEYRRRGMALNGSLILEIGNTGDNTADLEALGRADPSSSWTVLKYNLDCSKYLDWKIPYTKAKHEVWASLRGQEVLGSGRITPSCMYPAGGLYSVRGYPQSLVAGDSATILTLEYRLHLAPMLKPSSRKPSTFFGSPFRLYPGESGEPPDWDLVPKVFVDFGHVRINEPLSYEDDTTLASLGVGVNLRVKKNFFARVDVGFPLKSVDDATEPVDSGDPTAHFVVGFSF